MSRPSLAGIVVVAACAGAVALLGVQILYPFPFLNDDVLHFGLVESLSSASTRGQDLLDPWVPMWTLGFPVFHYYQILPHLLVVALERVTFGCLGLLVSFRIVETLAAGTLPIPVFFAARRFGFSPASAACAAILALAPRTNYLHGLELESVTWQGLGQFTQAVGVWILPLALATSWTAIARRSSVGVAAGLVAVTTLCHVAFGALALLCAGAFVLLAPREIPRRLLRFSLLAGSALAGASMTLVPIARDFAYYNVSALVPSWKYHSFGHEAVLRRLVGGELFDFSRPPVMTALVLLGLALAAWRARRDEAIRALLTVFVMALALYFGRPTWGRLLDLLPLGSGFHYSRVLALLQLAGALLAGLAAGTALSFVARAPRLGRFAPVAAAVLALAVASPLAADRVRYLLRNAELVRESAEQYERERDELEDAVSIARGDRMGRVYAGLGPAGGPAWGGAFMVGWVPVYDWFPLREIDAFGYLHHHYSLNADLFDRFDERNPVHYRVFGIDRIVAPPQVRLPAFAHEIARRGRFRVLQVDGGGFAELADVPYSVNVGKRTLGRVQARWLASPLPGAGVHPRVRLAEAESPDPGGVDGSTAEVRLPEPGSLPDRGRVESVVRRGEDFVATAAATRPCVLVLKMTFHPAWKATVDGRAAQTIHVLPSYVGVPLEAGSHRVELRYDPGPQKTWLALGGALVLAAAMFLGARARTRSPSSEAA